MSGRFGVIMSFDENENTATVVISKQETNEIEDVLRNVPCPVMLGVQTVMPSPGRPCWVVFKDGNVTQPIVTHYFNHNYGNYDYANQVVSPNQIPSYLLR